MNYAKKMKQELFSIIDEMDKNPSEYVVHPDQDFVRKRKLPLSSVLKCILTMEDSSIKQELYNSFDYKKDTPSAFVQQRKKISTNAFFHILNEFNNTIPHLKLFYGYRLLDCDGSVINSPRNIIDNKENYNYFTNKYMDDYYQMHLNALYDLTNEIYVDVCMSARKTTDERGKFMEMFERNTFNPKTIFVADRGYDGFGIPGNLYFENMFYFIRVKENKRCSILNGLELPTEDVFDVTITKTLTFRNGPIVKSDPDKYLRIHRSKNTKFLTSEQPYREMKIRVVRIKVAENMYETIITNLSKDKFSVDTIKEIYKMRWGIETSFRHLKYKIGISQMHSKKIKFIEQEILAKIILFNFCGIIALKTIVRKKNRKYSYKVNKNTAIYLCLKFIRSKKGAPDLITLIEKELQPVRPGRNFKRKAVYVSPVNFLYRAI